MKIKKAFIVFLLINSVLLVFSGCGGKSNDEQSSEITTATNLSSEATDISEENPLLPIMTDIINKLELPQMVEVTDSDMIQDFFLIDKNNENYENIIIMQCPMSASMTEIILIKAKDVKSAKEDLIKRQDKAKEKDTFYPNDRDKADSSIVGTYENYAYFILTDNPEDVEKELLSKIKS
jgi:hypothetical protein